MNKPWVILGAGGHARVLAEALLRAGQPVMGCVAPEVSGELPTHVTHLGNDEVLDSYGAGDVVLVNGLGSVRQPVQRIRVFDQWHARGYRFASVVHPGAQIASDVLLGEGVQIMAGAVVQPGCRLGVNVIVNTGAVVDHDCTIGAHAHLAPGVVLSGGVHVGEGAHIGTGARVIQGVSIGTQAVVGAGAVVIADVPSHVTVVGVPARQLKGVNE